MRCKNELFYNSTVCSLALNFNFPTFVYILWNCGMEMKLKIISLQNVRVNHSLIKKQLINSLPKTSI